ncbi:MAG: hypothetical protein DLM72_02380 [Candidatus Nitrosopolaris wilkensis]|nr:MAG: hypothetical protein DLM72_02380 [Candidatus Nitrosopolaris wilkensis]
MFRREAKGEGGAKEQELQLETVLVMQGGGSLGAYECGVYKTLEKHDIKFDIIAGTSIGAINAAIITGAKQNRDPANELEDFWLNLAETIMPPLPIPFALPTGSLLVVDRIRAILSSMFSATWGNPNAFFPIWFFSPPILDYFSYKLPYPLFDMTPLKNTLNDYVDFTQLKNPDRPRLIVTSTDIQTSKPIIFDSKHLDIDADHIIAGAGFPFYGLAWTQKNNRYLWDGCLLSNTPLRDIIDSSPIIDKKAYLVNVFPHYQKELPRDMLQAWHRARDIIYCDKTDNNIRMSKIISRHLSLLKDMHDVISTNVKMDNKDHNKNEKLKERLRKIDHEYNKLARQRGAIIQETICIERTEESHFLFEDTDFSADTIKRLLGQGEKDAEISLTQQKN